MALEGDLEDVALTLLIQMACSDKKTARLTIRALEGKGDVFFEAGEIVHAEVGLLEGEKAVYRLLGSTSGRFRLSTESPPPSRRTIQIGWNKLLMEGMRLLDERRMGSAAPEGAPTDGSPGKAELRLEADLLALVSRLEQQIPRCDERNLKAKPSLLLQVLEELVNDVAEFSERIPDARLKGSLQKALLRVNDEFPYARILPANSNRLSVQTAIDLYDHSTDTETRNYFLKQLRQALLQVLEEFFEFFATCFESADGDRQWRDTFRVYLADLTRAVTQIVP
ncbi:MAG: DUF4388 domain-containing protein [Thermoanaerobaculia bacterium]